MKELAARTDWALIVPCEAILLCKRGNRVSNMPSMLATIEKKIEHPK